MRIDIKLDTSRTKKQGHPIIISIYKSIHDRKYPFTGHYSNVEDWDSETSLPKTSHPNYFQLMNYILELKLKILKVQPQQSLSAEQVKYILLGQDHDFYSFWESRASEYSNQGQRTALLNTLAVFKEYRKSLDFEDIDYNFLQGFKRSKKATCKASGINTYLKNIRSIYNEGIRRGLHQPTSFTSPFAKIMEVEEKSADKYFTIEEVRKIYNKPTKSQYDNYFLLQFFLGGLDFIDIANIRKSHIRNGRIKFTRHKGNTNEVIDNFIFPEAQAILQHFNGTDYLTDIHSYKSFTSTRNNYTKRYRNELKALEISSYFTTKTPRYSFIHIGTKELYLNRDIIKELVGHSQNDTTSIYEGKFPTKIKDEIHRKIIDSIVNPTTPTEDKNI